MKLRWIFFSFCMVILSACGPSHVEIEQTVQVSIAQTERSRATSTPIPTNTTTPTATATVTPRPSPTPDIRVIDTDPRELLLEKTDLPAEGKYVLPGASWISPLTNAEIVASWTVEEGQAYLAETSRIDGWWVTYKRGSNQVVMPQEVYDNAVIYARAEGAQLIVTKYGDEYVDERGFTELSAPRVGDVSRAFQKSKTDANGGKQVWLRLIFSYRNVYHTIELWGSANEVKLEFALDVANTLIARHKELPLSSQVNFTP